MKKAAVRSRTVSPASSPKAAPIEKPTVKIASVVTRTSKAAALDSSSAPNRAALKGSPR